NRGAAGLFVLFFVLGGLALRWLIYGRCRRSWLTLWFRVPTLARLMAFQQARKARRSGQPRLGLSWLAAGAGEGFLMALLLGKRFYEMEDIDGSTLLMMGLVGATAGLLVLGIEQARGLPLLGDLGLL